MPSPSLRPAPTLADPTPGGGDAGAADAVLEPPSSGGRGGLACTRTEELGEGRTSCVTNVGTVEVKIVQPNGGSGPLRLGLYVHGDGAAAHKSSSALAAMVPWTDAKHGLGVSVLAPNGCSWWQAPAHDCASSEEEPDLLAQNTPPLVAALEAIARAYDVRTDGIDYYSSSGGSIFLANEWITLEGSAYPGVFALMCGGVVPTGAWAWNPNDPGVRDRLALYFTYGDQDFLFAEIQAAVSAFKERGFDVTEKVIPGAAHCAFDAHAEAMSIWLGR